MVVVMQEGASEAQILHVTHRLEAMGFAVHRSTGARHTVLGAVGAKLDFDTRDLELLEGVREIIRISAPYKLASRNFRPEGLLVACLSSAAWRRLYLACNPWRQPARCRAKSRKIRCTDCTHANLCSGRKSLQPKDRLSSVFTGLRPGRVMQRLASAQAHCMCCWKLLQGRTPSAHGATAHRGDREAQAWEIADWVI